MTDHQLVTSLWFGKHHCSISQACRKGVETLAEELGDQQWMPTKWEGRGGLSTRPQGKDN